jgi:hypothetical protein
MPNRHCRDTGERCLARGVGRAKETLDAEAARSFGDREDAANPAQPAVERELTHRSRAFESAARHLLGRGEQRQRDGQVEPGTLLAELRGRKVHRDAPLRKVQLGSGDPAAHTLSSFLARAIGQTDDREPRNSVADVRLDVDAPRLETDKRMRDRACKHASTLRPKPLRK